MMHRPVIAAALAIGISAPALAQHANHANSAPSPTTVAADDPACPAEHAAMGHCTPKSVAPNPATPAVSPKLTTAPPARQSESPPAAAVAVDASCPPEHAAMGHCTPKPAGAVPSPPAVEPRPAQPAVTAAPAGPDPACPPEHAAMGHCTPRAAAPSAVPTSNPHAVHNMDASQAAVPMSVADLSCPPEHAAMGHCTPKAGRVAAAPPVAPPPQAALAGPEHAADTVWDSELMAEKRLEKLIAEHGGFEGYMVLFDRTEYRLVDGKDGYGWDWEGWYGGDYDRLWVKSEGEGTFGESVEGAEVQALWSHALDPWFNLQTGVRYDIRPQPDRAHLAVGIQGLAPYWFEVDGAVFLSNKGDLTARFEAEYDQRITNELILQPRVEFDLAAQDVPELGIGSGLSSMEMGVRLRYEIERELAPYIGVQYERRFGDTADFTRAAGEEAGGWAFLVGLRSWF